MSRMSASAISDLLTVLTIMLGASTVAGIPSTHVRTLVRLASPEPCGGTLSELALSVIGDSYNATEVGIKNFTSALTPGDPFVHDYRKQLVRPSRLPACCFAKLRPRGPKP